MGKELALPHNVEAEQAVLGSILLDDTTYELVNELLASSDFYKDAHSKIYRGISWLVQNGTPVDLVTLHAHLGEQGWMEEVGGSSYLTYLMELGPLPENSRTYAELVKKSSKERRACEAFIDLDYKIRSGRLSYEEAYDYLAGVLNEREGNSNTSLNLRSWAEIVGTEEPEIEFLIEDLLPASCLLILAGKPKLGKSLLTLLFAISVGLGTELWGRKVVQGGVLFISTEDGEVRLKKRIWKMVDDPDKYNPNFHFHIGDCILTDKKMLDALKAKIREIRPKLVVLDPLINLFKGRELNSGEDMNEVLRPLQAIAKEAGAAVLVIHHARKSGGDDPIDVVQGSITISGVADGILILKHLRGETEDKRATLEVILKDAEMPKTSVLKLNEKLQWEVEGDLEEVRGRSLEDEILVALFNDGDGLTIRDLVHIVGFDYKPTYRALLKLEEARCVKCEKQGRSHTKVYSLESEWKTKMENEKQSISCCNDDINRADYTSFSTEAILGKRKNTLENEKTPGQGQVELDPWAESGEVEI